MMANKHFPSKNTSELSRIAKTLVASGVVSSVVVTSMYHTAEASEIKNDESTYIEKNATPTDPSLRHTSIDELHKIPSYIGSSFVDKYNQLSSKKQGEVIDKNLMDEHNDDKSYLKLNHHDYLNYVSANGDNLFVHYVTEDGKNLGFSKSGHDDEDKKDNNGSHAGGFFIYPFMLGGTSYHSSGSAPMKSDMKSSTGKNTYNTNANSKSFKTSSQNVSKGVSNASSKGMSSSSSRGMGGSMSSGGRGASSGAGG